MQQLNPSEISDIIKQRISQLDVVSQATNEGTIVSVTDGIIRIHGLTEVQYGEMIEFEGNVFGLALNLERDSVGAVVLGDYKQLAEGQTCRCTGRILEVPVGPELQGRVVDALGNPIDGKGAIETTMTDALEKPRKPTNMFAIIIRGWIHCPNTHESIHPIYQEGITIQITV